MPTPWNSDLPTAPVLTIYSLPTYLLTFCLNRMYFHFLIRPLLLQWGVLQFIPSTCNSYLACIHIRHFGSPPLIRSLYNNLGLSFPLPIDVRAFDGRSSTYHFHIPSVEPTKLPKAFLNSSKTSLLSSPHYFVISSWPTTFTLPGIFSLINNHNLYHPLFLRGDTKKNSFSHYLLLLIISNAGNCCIVSHQNHFHLLGLSFLCK